MVGTPFAELPSWRAVLAVVAHPDDESFALGSVLATFSTLGASTTVLCFTRGEASTLHGVAGDLQCVRAEELACAASELGVSTTILRGYPDDSLEATCRTRLAGEVLEAARHCCADGLLVFDPSGVTGHPDHVAATKAALTVADLLGLPVLGWTLPVHVAATLNAEYGTSFRGHAPDEIDYVIRVVRDRQRAASAAHASQALPTSVLWRRLDLLGDSEHLRQLRGS